MAKTVLIHKKDNVIIALETLEKGTLIHDEATGDIIISTPIPIYHKLARVPIKKGQPVLKYGKPIGVATEDIGQGAHVHTHNMDSINMM